MDKFLTLIRFIFICDLTDIDKDELKKILKSIVSLNLIIPMLVHHKLVTMFAYMILKNGLIYDVEKEVWRLVTRLITIETLRDKEYIDQFCHLSKEFEKEEIKYAVLKGFHFNQFLYKKSGAISRAYNDIDLLISRDSLSKINNILQNNGFFRGDYDPKTNSIRKYTRKEEMHYLLTSHQAPQYIKPSQYYSISPSNLLIVDVNFSIFEGGMKVDPISSELLLSNCIYNSWDNNIAYYSLQVEDDLLQLIYHIFKDTQYQTKISDNESLLLGSFCDLYMLISQKNRKINWSIFIDKINTLQLGTEVYFILGLLNKLVPMQVVEDCLMKLNLPVKETVNTGISDAFSNWYKIKL